MDSKNKMLNDEVKEQKLKLRQVSQTVDDVQDAVVTNAEKIIKVEARIDQVQNEVDTVQQCLTKFSGGQEDMKLMLQKLVSNMVVANNGEKGEANGGLEGAKVGGNNDKTAEGKDQKKDENEDEIEDDDL